MKRNDFLKRLGIGATTLVVAPKIIADNLKSQEEHKILKEPFDVPYGVLKDDGIPLYNDSKTHKIFTANITNKNEFKVNEDVDVRVNDVLFVHLTPMLEASYIVTNVTGSRNFKATCFKKNTAMNGEVDFIISARNFTSAKDNKGNTYYYTKWELLDEN